MRVIFSQRFNTSQLASVQGGRLLHPARPDSRPSPVLTLPLPLRHYLFISLFQRSSSQNCPPKLQYWQKENQKNQSV